MLKDMKSLLGKNMKNLYFPIFLMCIDSLGSMLLYVVLYLTVIDVFFHTFTMTKVIIYSVLCLIGVLYRIFIYQKSYLLCFTSAFTVSQQLRIKLADHLRKLPLGYFHQNNAGKLISTLTNDVGSFEGVLSHALAFVIKTFTLCTMILAGTFFIDWRLALSELVVILISLPLLALGNKITQSLGSKKRLLSEKMIASTMEYIKGIKVFKSHNMTSKHFTRLLDSMEKVRKHSIKIEAKMAVPTTIYAILVHFIMPIVLLCGSFFLFGGQITEDNLIAFLIMSTSISGLLVSFEHYYIMLKSLNISTKNLSETMRTQSLPYSQKNSVINDFSVEFRNVSFGYSEKSEVLHGINFYAKQGTITALVGPSGSGKSTSANLIARFFDVDSGEIRIGGVDIKEINPDELLKNISAVFQENTLLSDSIYQNILVGNPNATKEEVIAAAKAACCHDFIISLQHGYDTFLAEGGVSLSGGERQRIAIARAILKDASILLLDESTASLDADNEANINKALDELMGNKTVFVIAHRLNTIKNADQIIVLNEGHIEDMGTHEELISHKGRYFHMVSQQEKAKEWIAKVVIDNG